MESNPIIYLKPALAVFKDRKILMVRDNVHLDVWFMLGGKQEPGETEIECLKREVQEEVATEVNDNSLSFLHEFEDVSYGKKNSRVRIRLYRGELAGEPKPSSEITDIGYFDSKMGTELQTPISIKIFDWLKQNDFID